MVEQKQFFFGAYEIGAVIRPNYRRTTSYLDDPLDDHVTKVLSIVSTTSKCTARVFRQVKRKPHHFHTERRTDTYKGPNCSTPELVNEGDWKDKRSFGRSAMGGETGSAFRLRQTTQVKWIEWSTALRFKTANFCFTKVFDALMKSNYVENKEGTCHVS